MIELLTHKLSLRNKNELRIFSDEKVAVFASLRLSLRMRKGVFKEEVSESQKEGVEGEKQRQEMGGYRSKSDSR